ncbi:NAD-dependent epimerase/dehydratase family protein [Tautonia plasticadhaerens]|uniref:GDP-6-deoxy-D-mannose reductase n=1 Tax=Tautonia plasticadhaerens TaxID=2527974 RepID=A0A518H3S8_9BACT|nr:NAD(P)-dependent oxidoreductase [Tautonia plasticadhaerens]QDV35472.1 GDP-6-deoxy-D-mannose reductase [Tautonia plasticadhaerens]
MRALVTGATGFVGSHLVEHLLDRGHAVAVVRRPGGDPRLLRPLLHRVVAIDGDLGGIAASRDAIDAFRPDTTFHLAWSGVAGPGRDDASQVEGNVSGTLELLRVAATAGCGTFVGLGSQAEFGPRTGAIGEDAPADPTTWYGIAKACTHLMARRLADDLGVRFAWIRLFSAYGPGDHGGALIPTLIRSLLDGGRPSLTAGEQRWDFLYITDAAEALRLVAESPDGAGPFNLGSGRVHRIADVAAAVRDLIDPSLPLGLGERPYGPRPIMHLQADVGRLREAAGWEPRTSLDEGLRRTIQWHRRAA